MRALGLHLDAIDEDFRDESGRAKFDCVAVRDGKFDEQGERPMIGSELDVKPEKIQSGAPGLL